MPRRIPSARTSRLRGLVLLVGAVLIAATCSVASPDSEVSGTASPTIVILPTVPPPTATAPPPTPTPVEGATDGADSPQPPATPSPAPSPTATPDVSNAVPGAPGLGDNYYPTFGNGGYDVELYDLTLDWNHTDRALVARARITLRTTEQLAAFNFDFGDFYDITSLSVNDTEAAWSRDGLELTITPAAPIPDETQAIVEILYAGAPELVNSLSGPFSGGWTDLGSSIVVVGEPESATSWYPVNDHPTDKAAYRITVTTDEDLTVAANGVTMSVETNDGRTTWVFDQPHPQAPYLTTVAIGDFVRHDDDPSQSGIPVRHWFHRPLTGAAIGSMANTDEMIDVFEELFGPYPFDVYGSIVVEADLGFALETQTASVFGSGFVDGTDSYDWIVAHELAHQWFGNHVSLGQWSDIWLNEGFASYAEHLWFEASDPTYDIDAEVRAEHERWAPLLTVPSGAPPPDDLFHPSVYLRGSFTLHALRLTVGDDAFFSIVRTWVDEHGGDDAVTSDFTRLAQDISGLDLSGFFDAWLFSDETPPMPSA